MSASRSEKNKSEHAVVYHITMNIRAPETSGDSYNDAEVSEPNSWDELAEPADLQNGSNDSEVGSANEHANEDSEDFEYSDSSDNYDDSSENEDEYVDDDDEEDYDDYEDEDEIEPPEILAIDLPPEILQRYDFIGELPGCIGVMGGVARSIARETLTGEREPVRDIDLVNITDDNYNSQLSDSELSALSNKYMPDDAAFGNGIRSSTLQDYFMTRDFTVNECLIKDNKLFLTETAQSDLVENIICPSNYELAGDNTVSSRIFLKALMMQSVLRQTSESVPTIEGIDTCPDDVRDFDIALYLNKSMSRDVDTACIFTEELGDWGVINDYYVDRPIALAQQLIGSLYSFEFRPSTDAHFRDTPDTEDMDAYFVPESLDDYHATDPTIQRAIDEYSDQNDHAHQIIHDRDSLASGHYTKADYDAINSCRS